MKVKYSRFFHFGQFRRLAGISRRNYISCLAPTTLAPYDRQSRSSQRLERLASDRFTLAGIRYYYSGMLLLDTRTLVKVDGKKVTSC
jgi:hypothetical protein